MYRPVLLIAVLAWGCKSGEHDRASTQRAPDLQIVSAGNEPRRVLRYQLAKGTTQKLELAVDIDVTANDMGGAMPTMVMTLAVTVEDVLPFGARLRATVVDATARDRDDTRVDPDVLSGPLALMKGLAITATLTPSGRVVNSKLELGDKKMTGAAKAQFAALGSSFDQLLMPLPERAVGVGAVWRTSRPIEQSGMKLTAVNAIELTAIDGDTLSFSIDTQIHGDDQTVKQDELSVDIKDIVGTGKGTGTIDLKTLAITNELTSQLRSAMQATGEPDATKMTMAIATRVTPR